MYFEDVDISRRVRIAGFRTVVYPKAIVVHDHTFKSLFNFNTIKFFFNSSIYYFNKWGWFIDKNRIIDNSFTLLTIENRNK
jgi:GT2 family glycosyltransferase